MLRYAEPSEFRNLANDKRWVVSCADLREKGIRSPQGFSFAFGEKENFLWTTQEFPAYLFFKRFGWAAADVATDFVKRQQKEDYLYKLSFATELDKQFIKPEGLEYRPHQLAGIEYCLLGNNILIADEQRIGKTAVAIGFVNNTKCDKILVLAPKTAKIGWENELNTWLVDKRKIQILTARSVIDPTAGIYIANYDILHVLPELQKINFDLIIPDECHLICRAETRRAKFFFALTAKKIIALSGTPLLNNPKDLLAIAKWLDPFWESFHFSKGSYVSKIGISLTLDEAQDIMRSTIMLRRLQAQVFEAEPPEVRIVPVEAPLVAKEWIEKEFNTKDYTIGEYARIRKILGLYKINNALNYIDTYTTESEKLVVFAYHREVIDRLAVSLGAKAVKIYGDSSDAEREAAKKRFNEDPNCLVMIGSIGAASMALNLSISYHILFIECDWSNGMMSQAMERCSDLMQKFQVLIEILVFIGSLDEYILNKVDKKNGIVDEGID